MTAREDFAATPADLSSDWPSRRLPWFPVLMLHRVVQPPARRDPHNLRVTTRQLEALVTRLRGLGFRIVTLRDALEAARRGEDVRRLACLTFDDGYADFYTNAYPALERLSAPATVFLVSERIGATNAWDDGEPGTESVPLMTRDQVLELANRGVDFGSHAATHPRLSRLDAAAVEREVAGSKRTLEALLQREVPTFCYPYVNQSPAVRDAVAAAGYIGAVGGSQLSHTPYLLHRVNLWRWNEPFLSLKLSGRTYRLRRLLKGVTGNK